MDHQPRSFWSFLKAEYGGNFTGDLSGGITTAIVALPLAIAFAIASGVAAKYGIYTAIVAGVVASAFGGSKVQISGPTGGMAAVLIGVTTQFGYQNVVIIALIAGLFQIGFGVFRLGRFVKMLPFPLVAGFTMGIAVVIFGGQLDHAFGIAVHHSRTEFFDRLLETLGHVTTHGVNTAALSLAVGTIVFLSAANHFFPKIPAAILAVVLGSWVTAVFSLSVSCIGDIPRFLPTPSFPTFSWNMFRELLRPALVVAALGSIESLLAAVVADSILGDGSKHRSNRELIGQGMANIASSFFGGIPCTGAIARTVVNVRSGGRTRLAGIIHSLFLLLALLYLAPLASHIPIPILAGILMFTSFRMVEWREVHWLTKAPMADLAVMLITVGVTIFTDLVLAVEFGLMAAAILFIRKMSQTTPTHISVSDQNQSLAMMDEKIRVFRIPGPMFWGMTHAVIEAIEECQSAKIVILKMQYVTHIDASGVAVLREAAAQLRKRGAILALAHVQPATLKVLEQMHVVEEIGRDLVFATFEDAKTFAFQRVGSTAMV